MLILVHFWHLLFILFFFGPVKLLGGFDGQNWNKKWVNEKCRCRTLQKKKKKKKKKHVDTKEDA